MDTNKRTMICPKCGAENLSWRLRCQACGILLHEEDINTVKISRWGPLEWAALVSGLIGTSAAAFSWWFVFAIAEGKPHITDPIDWLFVLGTGLLGLGGVAVGWKWALIGGVLLIVEGLVPTGIWWIQNGFNFLGYYFSHSRVCLLWHPESFSFSCGRRGGDLQRRRVVSR